jgi:hypothetical protein
MKKYTTFILVGIIILLAAVLTGVLVFMKNQPAQERAFEPLVEIKSMEPDSEKWGVNFPNQYTSFLKTKTNNIDTTYAVLCSCAALPAAARYFPLYLYVVFALCERKNDIQIQ